MKVNSELREWFTNASYEELVDRWITTGIEDPLFWGESGDLYVKALRQKNPDREPMLRFFQSNEINAIVKIARLQLPYEIMILFGPIEAWVYERKCILFNRETHAMEICLVEGHAVRMSREDEGIDLERSSTVYLEMDIRLLHEGNMLGALRQACALARQLNVIVNLTYSERKIVIGPDSNPDYLFNGLS